MGSLNAEAPDGSAMPDGSPQAGGYPAAASAAAAPPAKPPALTLHGRVDWILPDEVPNQADSSKDAPAKGAKANWTDVSPWVLASHSLYVSSPDVARFVHCSRETLSAGHKYDQTKEAGALEKAGQSLSRTGTQLSKTR